MANATINCEKPSLSYLKLEAYSLENYFSPEALRTVLGDIGAIDLKVDPTLRLDKQLRIENGMAVI